MVGIAAEGYEHTLTFYWQSNGGTLWNASIVDDQGATDSAPSIAQFTNENDTSKQLVAVSGEDVSYVGHFYWQLLGAGAIDWNAEVLGTFGA